MADPGGAGDTALRAALEALLDGLLVGMPTETVYGLAGDAGSASAVAAIYAAKGRPADHPLIVHVSGAAAARRWMIDDAGAERLMQAFWPGPLTLIVRRRPGAPAHACAGQPTVGLRCPSHPVAQRLLQAFEAAGGLGVAAPSANRFGRISATRADDVRAELGDAAAVVLDGGDAEIGLESTIVDLTCTPPAVRRPGAVSPEHIAQVLGVPVARAWLAGREVRGALPVSGTLAAHYAPSTALRLVRAEDLTAAIEAAGASRVALWSRRRPAAAVRAWLALPDDPRAFAHALYAGLRALDASGAALIVVETPPSDPEWEAVNDRLARAAAGARETEPTGSEAAPRRP